MRDVSKPAIVLAAGGTGGHLFPAEALAGELQAAGIAVYLATDARGMAYGGQFPAVARYQIRAATPSGKSPLALLNVVFALLAGTLQSIALLRHVKPRAVVGFGGYPSVPPLLAAALLRIPIVVHEQNGVIGRANRFVGRFAQRIGTGFERPKGLSAALQKKASHCGNPLRPQVQAVMSAAYPALNDTSPLILLVTGGSQGARVMSSVVPQALALLPDDFKARLRITHQARGDDVETARELYKEAGLDADIRAFFDDLPVRIAASHLVIARAGASTIAELSAIGRPSILVPLPGALDQDQAANAESLARLGAAFVVPQSEFTPQALSHLLVQLFSEPHRLTSSSQAAKSAGIPDAAARFARLVLSEAFRESSRGESE